MRKNKIFLIILLLIVSLSFSISVVSASPGDNGINYSNATEKETGNKNITWKENITIVDKVNVRGQPVLYRLEAVLYDKNTGKPFEINGKNFTVIKYFDFLNETHDPFSNKTVEIEFVLNLPKEYQNLTLVVYNYLYAKNTQAGDYELEDTHANISDTNQTIYIGLIPEIGTSAKENNTGNKVIVDKNKAVIIDTVKYKNLVIGKEYTLTGILMNKNTGKALLINGQEITATKTFIANSIDGTTDLEFIFDIPKGMGNFSVVVFEKLFDVETNVEIATHEDINDENQTVDIIQNVVPPEEFEEETPEPPEEEYPETPENPNDTPPVEASMKSTGMPIMMAILVLLSSLGLIVTKKK